MDTSIVVAMSIGFFILGAIIFAVLTFLYLDKKAKKAGKDAQTIISKANKEAESNITNSNKQAESIIKDANDKSNLILTRAKDDGDNLIAKKKIEADALISKAQLDSEAIKNKAKMDGEAEISQRRIELNNMEQKLSNREELLDKREDTISNKESALDASQKEFDQKSLALKKSQDELQTKIDQVDQELSRISGLSQEEAKKELMAKVEEQSSADIAQFLKEKQEEAEDKAEANAKNILCGAIERYSQEVVTEHTVTTVALPNDDMKGRIIGREGRNIKSLESILGCDIVIDDTPEVLTVSSFNPVRREIAVRTLEALIKDGRIQPGKIEELHDKITQTMDDEIRKTGEDTVMSLGLPKINRELCKYIGTLKFRTSFGQNALDHCIQVSLLCGMMAAELGLDQTMAKRCGLLHDIGKAADFEMEGSHVEIGVRLAKKYGEPDQVVSAIASHHGDVEKRYLTDELVVAADTLSAARPGARSETLENYIKRVEDIEKICKSYPAVQNCYALQSGRDVRVMVIPEKITDAGCFALATQIKDRIQNEMIYPGNIKVTIIRETRAIEIAK